MFYTIVAVWVVICFVKCVLKPSERAKLKDLIR